MNSARVVVLHLLPSDIRLQTRLFKEAAFTVHEGICDEVSVLGLKVSPEQAEQEMIDQLQVFRARTLFYKWRATWIVKYIWPIRVVLILLGAIQYGVSAVKLGKTLGVTHVSCHYLTSLPQSWLAAQLCGAKLVYLPHELEVHRWGVSKITRPIHMLIEWMFIGAAEGVVVVCEPIARWYKESYRLECVGIVRNLPERAALTVEQVGERAFRDRFCIPEHAVIIIYQGVLSEVRGVYMLIEIFSRFRTDQHHLVLMGFGDEADIKRIRKAAATFTNVHFQPGVPRELILSYTSGADVGIYVSENPPINDQLALPNKFFEFVHAGLPVIVSDNLRYLSEVISAEGIGWSTRIENVGHLISTLSVMDVQRSRERVKAYAADAVWEVDAKEFRRIYGR